LSYTETSSFLEFERMVPIFRPEVINKIQNRVMGSAQTRRNPTSLLNRGRPTTGANATATTNPTGAQTMGQAGMYSFSPQNQEAIQRAQQPPQRGSMLSGLGGLAAPGIPSFGIQRRVPQHDVVPTPFVDAGAPQYQGREFAMGGNLNEDPAPPIQRGAILDFGSGESAWGDFGNNPQSVPLPGYAETRGSGGPGLDREVNNGPDIAAMEAESRRISRQGSILENSDIATSSGQARQNFQNLPSDMQQDAVATIPSQGYNGNIGYANDPDRYDPTDPGAQRQQEDNARATTQGRVREGNDAFGDRFRNAPQDGFMTEAEKQADFERRAPAARAVADQKKADLAARRAADPEAEYARKLSIAQASADREAKHNSFKEKTGGLNYKQFDRLTRKIDLIEKKVGQGRITKEEAKRQVENITDMQNRRADGASGVAAERLRRVESQKPMDRTRLPNGSLPEATRMKAEQTANQLTDPNYTKGSPEFNQSREVLSSVGIDSADSAASASKKISGTPFPMEDPEAARRAAMSYRMYWGSKKDASKDWTKDESWGLPGFASERTDPQFAKMMEELTSTPTSEIDAWIEKYSGHLAMFGQDKSKYDALTKPKHIDMTELNERLPENASPFPGRFGGY
jgi:hypothetical protein